MKDIQKEMLDFHNAWAVEEEDIESVAGRLSDELLDIFVESIKYSPYPNKIEKTLLKESKKRSKK